MQQNDAGDELTPRDRRRLAAVLAALAGAALLAQSACSSPRGITREAAAASTFQVRVDLVVHEKSAPPPVVFFSTAGVFDAADPASPAEPPDQHVSWSGTAWVAEHDRESGRAYLATAGHVCESRREFTVHGWAGDATYVVKSATYTLVAGDGTVVEGLTVLEDDDDVDVCVLSHQGWLGRPLPLATEEPGPGPGFYAGAAAAIWGGGFAPVYDVSVRGRSAMSRGQCNWDPWMKKLCDADGMEFTGAVTGGASGSALVEGGVVVGLVNLGPPSWPNVGHAVPWDAVARVLARARHHR